MKLILFTLFFNSFFIQANEWDEKYLQAEYYCYSIQDEFATIAETYDLDYRDVLPIIFPECLRFNVFSDQLETTALEYLYVKNGSQFADFSIGRFQMKPSFIERLEQELEKIDLPYDQKKKFQLIENSTNARAERVSRLTDLKWQIHYLCLFYKVVDQRYSSLKWENKLQKLSFFAAAYNYGFFNTVANIKKWENQCVFMADEYGNMQSYAQIASKFYLKNQVYAK